MREVSLIGNTLQTARLRIDKWLWQARFCKTRALAQSFVTGGKIRLNGADLRKPGALVKPGDSLEITTPALRFRITVLALGERRGPASEAQTLYAHLEPPEKLATNDGPSPGRRAPGSGRPTKAERRALEKFFAERE